MLVVHPGRREPASWQQEVQVRVPALKTKELEVMGNWMIAEFMGADD